MSVKQVTLVSALAVGAALLGYGMAGCELISSVDRTLIPSGTGGGVATGGGGTGGSIGGGGNGGTTGGTGGGGAPASCNDTVQNGNETDVDCGGDCPLTCANNQHCGDYTDCTSAFCDTTTEPPTCMACTTQANCADKPNAWCDQSVNGGTCVDQLADGQDCTDDFQCLHTHCADGVCCDTACAGNCDKCDVSGSVGTCTPVADADPGTPSCAPYLCDGSSADCPTTCAGPADCVANDAYCNASSHCVGTVITGQPCVNPGECASTFCVDLVCCGVAACGSANDCNVCMAGTGACGTAPVNHACDDANLCNGADQCDGTGSAAGNCSIHAGDPCTAQMGVSCNHACHPADGLCTDPEVDGSPCTNGAPCDGVDHCGGGTCSVHAGDPCTPNGDCNHACHPANGQCTDPETGTSCNDTLYCTTTDTCTTGTCGGTGDPCDACHTCNEGTNACDVNSGSCFISGQCYANGDANPANSCQYCDASGSPTAWADRAVGYVCATDNDNCTIDTCDASAVCQHVAECVNSVVKLSNGHVRFCVTASNCDSVPAPAGTCTSVDVPGTFNSWVPDNANMTSCTTFWAYTTPGVVTNDPTYSEVCYRFRKNADASWVDDPAGTCADNQCAGHNCYFTMP